MANMIKRGSEQQAQPTRTPRGEWNPWQRMRELLEWDPFQELTSQWPTQGRGEVFMPQFEVRETGDAYVFRADLPGVKEEDVDINVTGNRLTIAGKREAEQRNEQDRYYVYECSYGTFQRSFTLPDGVNPDDVKADLREGVLTLHVPKKAEAQPRRIQLGGRAGDGGGQKHKA
jgi:HSP20 family protein